MAAPPKLSIGLPVYNGQQYLARAVGSILAQTFRDFELIISDNASTDRTSEICAEFAAADQRVRYHRQTANIGAAGNFNRTFELATGEYFKWAAHDDFLAPTYLEKCVAALDAHPEAILCSSVINIVDDQEQVLEVNRPIAAGAASSRPAQRLAARFRQNRCIEVFAVVRRAVLARSSLQGTFIGADRVLLGELALLGPFRLIDEPLFFNRDHPRRATRTTRTRSRVELAAWYDPRRAGRGDFSTWISYREYLRRIRKHVPDRGERLRCYAVLLQSLRYRWSGVFLLIEPLMALDPRVLSVAKRVRRTISRADVHASEGPSPSRLD